MRTVTMVLGVLGLAALSGCAPASEGVALMQPQSGGEPASVAVGPARVLGGNVNPSAGVRVASDGETYVVRFAHPGHLGAVERLDASSLETLSQASERAESAELPRGVQRVVLDGGRFVVCWKKGDAESGYVAMAQAFDAAGAPRGGPVEISPEGLDVIGSLSAATFDGRHVIATFAASSGGSFSAYAVPLEAL